MDELKALLEDILYELRVANWQRAGGKRSGPAPVPPGMQAVTVGDRQVFIKRPEGVNDAINRSIREFGDDGKASA